MNEQTDVVCSRENLYVTVLLSYSNEKYKKCGTKIATNPDYSCR